MFSTLVMVGGPGGGGAGGKGIEFTFVIKRRRTKFQF